MKNLQLSRSGKLLFPLFVASFVCATTHAQLVNDSASVTFSGSANISGNLVVGTNGSFTSLTIANGGFVTNDASGIIGQSSTSRSNRVTVTGANSTWNNGTTVNIGSAGSFNLLVITNGGKVFNTFGNISQNNGSSNNAVIVTGSGSLWTNINTVNIGNLGSSNRVLVANGGWVLSGSALLGNSTFSRSNEVVITDAGSLWKTGSGFSVGADSSLNSLIVSNGGSLISDGAYVGAKVTGSGGGNSNSVVITGANSTWTNSSIFAVGDYGSANRFTISNNAVVLNTSSSASLYLGRQPASSNNVLLVTGANARFSAGSGTFASFTRLSIGIGGSGHQLLVRNGGTVEVDNGAVGDGGSQNVAVVADSDSTWKNFKILYVGYSGNSNQLFVTNNGTVVATNLILGNLENSSNNTLVVVGGNIFVTNSAKSGAMDLRRGVMTLNSGLVVTDNLLLTNGNSSELDFYAGTLRTRNTTVSSGATLLIGGNNARPTLELVGSGVHTFASGLSLSADATLIGSGSIVGNVINAGTVSPGNTNAIGRFEITGSLALQPSSTNVFELNKTSGTNDSIASGSVSYGGVLIVTNLGGTLAAGDKFQLFSASNYTGAFSSVTLPTLSAGLFWKTNLMTDGSIQVAAPPTTTQLTNASKDANGAFRFGFTNSPGANFSVLTTTNIALPLTNWTVLSGVIETSPGQYQFSDSQTTNFPQRFYLLRSP